MKTVRITALDNDGDWNLLVDGFLARENGDFVERVVLQAKGEHLIELAPGTYYYEFGIERHSGDFTIRVHILHQAHWTRLPVSPASFVPDTLSGRVATFEVP